MTPSRALRISTYLPLAIATAALGYAEAALLPEVGAFAVLVLIALAVIYRMESRGGRALTIGEFNRLGLCIGVVAFLWAGFRMIREFKTAEFASLGWTAFIVALVAPVLLAAVCALLLRREKKPGDYWFMQAAGLGAIVLAGAMAEETVLVVLTALYALSVVWFLAQFHRARAGGAVERFQVSRPALWLGIAAAGAVPLYLLTPRSPFDKLEFGQSRIEIGFAADQMIDLTQTGELQENPETAFEVQARTLDGEPKLDLDSERRWRGAVLVTYANGTWRRDAQAQFPTAPDTTRRPGPWSPPNLGPSAFKLEFAVPAKLRSTFLLDPVEWSAGQSESVAEVMPNGSYQPWFGTGNGRVFARTSTPRVAEERDSRYVQYSRPPREPDLSPAYRGTADVNRFGAVGANRALLANSVPRVKDYTDAVIEEKVAESKLPASVNQTDAVRLNRPDRHHEAIARTLRDHLSERTDLNYTTNLKRLNRTVDPVEDFLLHSKAGHCERFATALVLMLRSQGIPAVLVLGFKGCEHTGDGNYVVRQEFAHAWAEALISRPVTDEGPVVWHWLTLDPSPAPERSGGSTTESGGFSWSKLVRMIFHYTPEERERALKAIAGGLTSIEFLLGASGLLAGFLLVRTGLRRRRVKSATAAADAEWFHLLVAALAPRALVPEAGETAQEFAARAAGLLPDPVADVPGKWVEIHYGERFGGSVVDLPVKRELEHRLQEIAKPQEART